MAITATLKSLGLSDKEARLYIALLKRGRATPTELARDTKINRATVYAVAQMLKGKGLLVEDLAGKKVTFVALPIDAMEKRVGEERRELDQRTERIKEASRELSLISGEREYPVPKMQFVAGSELRSHLFASTRRWQKSALAHDGVWWGFQDHTFVEAYENWIHSTWKTPEARRGVKGHVVSNVSGIERTLLKKYPKEMRDVRTIMGMKFQSTLWVAGEYVVIIMTHQKPHYLYEIHDPLLAANLREVCKTLWGQARE